MCSMLERATPSRRLWQKLEQLCWSATTWLVLTTFLAHDNILLGQPNRYISSNHMLWWQSFHDLLSIKRLTVFVLQTPFNCVIIWDMKQYFMWIAISQEDAPNISIECYRAEQLMNYQWGWSTMKILSSGFTASVALSWVSYFLHLLTAGEMTKDTRVTLGTFKLGTDRL